MVFFTDRDLGGVIFPRILREAGLTVEAHRDHFAPNARDEEWLPQVARREWIILSSDQNMLRVPLERDAIMRSGGGPSSSWVATRGLSSWLTTSSTRWIPSGS